MKVILGTVQMGLSYGVSNKSGRIPRDKSIEILSAAFAGGIKYLDTAEAYGDAHSIIGDYHRLNPNKKFNIITKLPKAILKDQIGATIDKYLGELDIERINVLMFHDFETYNKYKFSEEFLHIRNSSKVAKVGVSIYNNQQFSEVLNDPNIDVIQIPYNLLDNSNKRGELMKLAHSLGKEIHTRSAFLQGLFFLSEADNNPIYNELEPYINKLKSIALQEGVSMQQLALSYCFQNIYSSGVLVGVDSIEQLSENLSCINHLITKESINTIDLINVANENLLNPTTWN